MSDFYLTGPACREAIQAHQTATDASDSEILDVLCDFMVERLEVSPQALEEFIVSRLERLPPPHPGALS